MVYAICLLLVVYGILGFSFATLLAIYQTSIDENLIVDEGGSFLFVSICWPVICFLVCYLSVGQLIALVISKLFSLTPGQYILRILDSWVSWLRR